MKLVLLLFVAVAANAATLGTSKCGNGPAYWCETMIQAKECGAVQYCLDNNWPNIKKMVHSSADQCTDCITFLGEVKNLLSNVTVQNMVLQYLEGFCQSLGSLAQECKDVISEYGSLVFDILLENFNVTCSDCKAFMGDIQKDLSNTTIQKMIIDELNKVCNSLGSFAPQCQLYVSQYGPMVLDLLAQYFDPDVVCVDIGLCKAEDAPRKLRFAANDVCSDCTTVVQDVVTILENPDVQKAIIHQVEKVCDDLGKVVPQCKQYVDNYAPLLFDLALQYLTPTAVCGALGLCSGKDADAFVRSNLLL
ncbi:Prosaposin [Holothuria leucospilota]|uniref:Pulmonary surfactant-associated protein B n=1 Tax=Holothuria leucospilota TaxID=206669 RepID=A0A9Q1HM62_HOLLE|nr:Prosaposin [Holothuria leucospilota]